MFLLHHPLPRHITTRAQVSILQLLAVSRLMNQAVGDALSGLLLCCAVLRSGTSLTDWQVRLLACLLVTIP
jgi:hypothetical protein